MAKTLEKGQLDHELEEDVIMFDWYRMVPPAGSWRRMRLLDYLFRGEAREARDGTYYLFWDFVEWYGPTRAQWYWSRAVNPRVFEPGRGLNFCCEEG